MRRLFIPGFVFAFAALLAACTSHGLQNVVPGTPQYASEANHAVTPVTVMITVATDSAPAAESRVRPHYFSRASRGLSVQAFAHGSSKVIGHTAVDISPGSAACGGKKSTPRTCSVTLMLAPSAGDDFALFDYNEAPVSGKIPKNGRLLALGKVFNKKISASAKKNKFSVYLDGVIRRVTSKESLIPFLGDGVKQTAALMISAFDYGNNPITAGKKDPYAKPITLSVTEQGGTGHTGLSLNGAPPATSVALKYSTDTVEVVYDGGGTIGYGARVYFNVAGVKNSQGVIGIQPLVLGSTTGDYTPGRLALRGNGEYQTIQIGEANAYVLTTHYSVTTENCNAIESTMPLVQTSAYGASFALITRGVAATPSASGCMLHVSDGRMTLDVQVSNAYFGSVGTPMIATTPIPLAGAWPVELTVGADGAIWFAECTGGALGHVAAGPVGSSPIHQVPLPAVSASPQAAGLYAGPDGTMWFTDENNGRVGNMTTAGVVVQEKSVGTGATPEPAFVTTGADGNMWFSYWCNQSIGTMPTSGSPITPYSANLSSDYNPNLALGPDGNIWFTDAGAHKIGKITTAGTITEFSTPTANTKPWGITAGPDGAMWFTECYGGTGNGAIGRIPVTATSGSDIEEFSTGMTGHNPVDITTGPDGALWFTYWATAAVVGRITTAATPLTTTITEYAIPGASATYNGWGITSGPDGAIWFSDNIDNVIGRIAIGSTPAKGRPNFVHRSGRMNGSGVPPSRRHHHRNPH